MQIVLLSKELSARFHSFLFIQLNQHENQKHCSLPRSEFFELGNQTDKRKYLCLHSSHLKKKGNHETTLRRRLTKNEGLLHPLQWETIKLDLFVFYKRMASETRLLPKELKTLGKKRSRQTLDSVKAPVILICSYYFPNMKAMFRLSDVLAQGGPFPTWSCENAEPQRG